MTFFITDLDGTLIHSKRFIPYSLKLRIVEYDKKGKALSYMTSESYKYFKSLNQLIRIIPITSRSIEQYKRISFAKDFLIAVTSNGGTILYNGKEDLAWKQHIKDKFRELEQRQSIEDILNKIMSFSITKYKLIDNSYYYFKIDNIKEAKKILDKELPIDWYYIIQKNKLYIMPKFISKYEALKYLEDKYLVNLEESYGAGDSIQDKDFLFNVKNKITFISTKEHSCDLWENLTTEEKNLFSVFSYGLIGTEDLLNFLNRFVIQENEKIERKLNDKI